MQQIRVYSTIKQRVVELAHTVQCTGGTGSSNPGRNGQISVKIVDLCPGCGPNQLDLSEEAFAMIANRDVGLIIIGEKYLFCVKITFNVTIIFETIIYLFDQ